MPNFTPARAWQKIGDPAVRFPIGTAFKSGTKAFTPADLPGLVYWGRADNTTAETGTGLVSAMPDMRGGTNPTPTAAGTNRPLLVANSVNGKPALVFDGVDDKLDFAANLVVSQVYAVFRSATPNFTQLSAIVENQNGGDAAKRFGNLFLTSNDFYSDPYPRAVSKNGVVLVQPYNLSPVNQWFVVRISGNNPTASRMLQIGAFSSSYYINGSLAEFIMVSPDLADSDDLKLRQYFQNLYGVGV